MAEDPTNCTDCNASLERGYVSIYRDKTLVASHCIACNRKHIMDDYLKTKRLTTSLVESVTSELYEVGRPWSYQEDVSKPNHLTFREIFESGSLEDVRALKNKLDVWESHTKIWNKIKDFEREVWFKGLQTIIMDSNKKGVSAELIGIKCLTFSMCARTMFTIDDGESSVTMMCTEDSEESTMHFRGISATEKRAIELIDFVIETFNDGSLKFEDDNEVSYCGM